MIHKPGLRVVPFPSLVNAEQHISKPLKGQIFKGQSGLENKRYDPCVCALDLRSYLIYLL
ncbi:hypothetical protein CANCADRAFT_57212 [Tortispora caseinolytica NRRL Y-17796]|uniref:Uncharacterized protein n=1 Tax=Tortispora caseinolytica NRRL Y-17796 TaxID=767744 RepID=A0A1E4TGF6_9ASCO|nr:hypothetical protein CANCADRAFT_57212 [Tortispora caseinolytica NRRL Y-17796]